MEPDVHLFGGCAYKDLILLCLAPTVLITPPVPGTHSTHHTIARVRVHLASGLFPLFLFLSLSLSLSLLYFIRQQFTSTSRSTTYFARVHLASGFASLFLVYISLHSSLPNVHYAVVYPRHAT
jgi:hypothetical protein